MAKQEGKFLLTSQHQVIYGIVLIILIPLAIIINTIVSIRSLQNNIDIELQRQALTLGRFFNSEVYNEVADDEQALQKKVISLTQANLGIDSLKVLVPEGDLFKVQAAKNSEELGQTSSDLNYVIAWHQDEAVATLVRDPKSDLRFWEIASPLHDESGAKKAVLSMRFSLAIMDQLVKDSLLKSYLILIITIIVVILLLILNTRLFEHALLFKKLKEVDQMKDEFISIASHELRTPITTLKGFLSMILEGDYGQLNEGGKKSLKIMELSINRLGALVEDLLNVSRIEQKRLQLDLKPLNISQILESIGDEFELRIKEKNLSFKENYSPTLPQVWADEDKLRQILINLLGNSVKYTKQGQIELLAKADEGLITITIKDTGIGMSALESQNLFSKFYRVKNDDTNGIIGTGLGLWITKQLVEMMGGKIYVESIKHVGTQIYFTLPRYDKARHHSAEPAKV